MKILALIPARSGSKGVPGKNTRLLAGSPLIAYTIKSALEAKTLTKIVVSTDSPEIAEIARRAGAEVPFLRPIELAQDHTPTLPVIQHALQILKERESAVFDAVCLLQPTSPFRPTGLIDRAIERFEESGADALISVLQVPTEYNPHWTFEPDERGFLKIATGESQIIPRRQELPKAFFRDGSIYITKTEVIMDKNSLYGGSLAYIEADPVTYVNIDTLADWEKAEQIARKIFIQCAE